MDGNKFSVIVRDKNNNIIKAVNVIGTYNEIFEEASEREKNSEYKYSIVRDKTLFEVIDLMGYRYIELISKICDVRDSINGFLNERVSEKC